jgi:superfamily II DNA or RNA helicase
VAFLNLRNLQRFVDSAVRNRAVPYARSGAVHIESRKSPTATVRARVAGTIPYTVSLRYADRLLLAVCSCPYFDGNIDLCKHIWATLIECEALRIAFPGPIDDLLVDDESSFVLRVDEDVEEDDEDEPYPANVRHFPRATKPAPFRRIEPPSRWRSQIGSVTSSINRHEIVVPPEIIWVIDPATSGFSIGLEITWRPLKKNGERGKPQPLRLEHSAIAGFPDPLDREILATLASPYAYGGIDSRSSIGWPLAGYLVPKLAATGRLWLRTGQGNHETGITFDAGEPWHLDVRAEEREGKFLLAAELRRGSERRPLAEALAISKGGLVIFRNNIARFADEGTHGWAILLQRDKVEIPPPEIDDFIKAVRTSGSGVKIELPSSVAWRERQGTPHATLEIARRRFEAEPHAVPSFEYDTLTVDPFDRAPALYDEQDRTVVLRDAAAEAEKLEALWAAGFMRLREVLSIPRARLASAIPKLIEAGWEVRGEEGVYAAGGQLELAVRSSIDWFDLDADITFGTQRIRLPRLLAALRKGESMVVLDDGTLGMIRPEWREQLEPFLATASEEHESGLRFRRNQVLLLDALLASRATVAFDDVFEQARRKILDVVVRPEQPPKTFRGALRPYQSEALGWFSFLRDLGFGGCLADDMGLGKTIQVLALLEQRRGMKRSERRPSLVVVPRSVVFNWKREAARFTPELRVLDHATPDRIRATGHFMEYDLVITTYALLRQEVERFADFEFDYAILDEAQAIKNATSQSAKAATLIRARHRLALSGTPVENHLGELASLFEFLNPGMLGAKTTRVTKMLRDAGGPGERAAESRTMLARTVRPFILRRTKAQVARELPERVEQTIYCDLEPKQRKLYDELRDFYRASLLGLVATKGLAKSTIHVLEALLRMRQAACHPGLVDAKRIGEESAKLARLFEELPILIDEGHKVLVFSQFTSLLAIVRDELKQRGMRHAYIDGKSRDREEQVRKFQEDPKVPLFLISLKAGGLGLNLTAADYVFLLDPWWNPAVEAQAIDRAHRIGQSRNVVAYRLVARDTIEEKILILQQSKRALAEAIISEENSILRQLTPEDLDLLLS